MNRCRRSSIVVVFWKVEGFGGNFKPRRDYIVSISLDLEVEAQSH